MLTDPSFLAALAYFSQTEHAASFETLPGKGRVLLSAPHAVLQTRNGYVKQAERYTGMLCQMLNQSIGCPCIYKTRHLADDANHDPASDYRDALCDMVATQDYRYVLDLHQLAPTRPMALCIGTGRGQNLHGDALAVQAITAAFEGLGLTPVTRDDPFAAMNPNTVSATAARAGAVALQLELNTRIVMETSADCRYFDVLNALSQAIQALNAN